MTQRARIGTFVLLALILILLGLEVASPFVRRRELRTSAGQAAAAAQDAYFRTGDTEQAAGAAEAIARDESIALIHLEVLTGGAIRVTVGDTAESKLLGRIGPLHRFYEVEATAVAPAKAGAPPGTSTTKAG